MKYTAIVAAAALAQFAQGAAHPDQHARIHNRHFKKDVVWVTEVVTVTAGANEPAPAPQTSTSTPAAAPSPLAPVVQAEVASSASSSSSSQSTGDSTSPISKTNLSPHGKKAGLSGFDGIQQNAASAFAALAPYISWYSDYTANTPTTSEYPDVMGVGMLWGADGSACNDVFQPRLQTFTSKVVSTPPEIMFGFYEPDCTCTMSSEMSVSDAATQWDSLIAPLAAKGTILGSPSMCKQKDEDFLTPFNSSISTTWDVTSIHINKPDLAGVQADVEYYASKYGKPVWVSEFACVHDSSTSFDPCTDQTEINQFINDVVPYFESNKDVVAYGASNGEGLLGAWPLTTSSGDLSTTGQTYLNAIKAAQGA